jgi:phosphoribosylformylglycinamidine (FGAM) synthase PurS component
VTNVRQGKQFVIDIDGELDGERAALLEQLAGELLSNPVIEDFVLTVAQDQDA